MAQWNIAIIDDEMQICAMLEKYLKKKGNYTVNTYTDPVEGLNHILASDTHLVLLDIMMPKMDGIEVLNKLKEKKPGTKVIMMTAFSTLDRVLKSHKIGAENYIMKPFDSLSSLEDKIIKALQN